mgnify:CR=1 FL=1
MKIDYRMCDRCNNEKVPDNLTMFITTGRSCDAAGDMDHDGQELDLCHACCIKLIKHLKCPNDQTSYTTGNKIVEWAKS